MNQKSSPFEWILRKKTLYAVREIPKKQIEHSIVSPMPENSAGRI